MLVLDVMKAKFMNDVTVMVKGSNKCKPEAKGVVTEWLKEETLG